MQVQIGETAHDIGPASAPPPPGGILGPPVDRVFPDGTDENELAQLYRPRPGRPFSSYEIAGEERLVWTTFTGNQIDLEIENPTAWAYLTTVLDRFEAAGVDLVRLDAVGYAVKRAGTSSFMIPETFACIARITEECRERSMDVLVEIHSHHRHQIEIARQVDRVYDFALPPLVLHALHTGDSQPLQEWLRIAPRNCVTVLDSHDGIGIIDVAPDGDLSGLLPAAAVDALVESIHDATPGRSREATGAAVSNLDLYGVNTTLFEAVGSDDAAHFVARLIQVLCPGIPQVPNRCRRPELPPRTPPRSPDPACRLRSDPAMAADIASQYPLTSAASRHSIAARRAGGRRWSTRTGNRRSLTTSAIRAWSPTPEVLE